MGGIRMILAALFALAGTMGVVAEPRLSIRDSGPDVTVELELDQAVPWRAYTLDAPPRLVIDLGAEVDWPEMHGAAQVGTPRVGRIQEGWSRWVAALKGPLAISEAMLATGAVPRLTLVLETVSPTAFAAQSGAPRAAPAFSLTTSGASMPGPEEGRLRVMLDPGHGGIDPGAEADGLREAWLMLGYSKELRRVLQEIGAFDVSLTREQDVFVPLERRIALAREFQADVFVSLHADALPKEAGEATGATVYTLSDEASDWASKLLAERHDQADLLAGVDLSGQGDEIALVLMDLARRHTAPRSRALAEDLVTALRESTGSVNVRPHRQAAFSVLKSPEIPSVLVEIGFLSSAEDRARLRDPVWRERAVTAMAQAIATWTEAEALVARQGLGE